MTTSTPSQIDFDWFMEQMRHDRVIVRAHIYNPGNRHRGGDREVYITALTYWTDDMTYNGAQVTYRQLGAMSEEVVAPSLTFASFPGTPAGNWHGYIANLIREWRVKQLWRQRKPVVCTVGCTEIPASHPEFLLELARFEGLIRGETPGVPDRIAYGIIARRLAGLNDASVKTWHQAMGLLPNN